MQHNLNPTFDGGWWIPPPPATLKLHSSVRKVWFDFFFMWIWSHGYNLWPKLKKSKKNSFILEIMTLVHLVTKQPVKSRVNLYSELSILFQRILECYCIQVDNKNFKTCPICYFLSILRELHSDSMKNKDNIKERCH